jgi:hypothetical protein
MKRITGAVVALFCVAGWNAAAQVPDKAHTETTTKQTGPGPTVKTKGETVTGIVKEYESGKKIKISGPADKTYSFDLEPVSRVDGAIVVGQMAKVSYHKSNDGTEHVAVISEAPADTQMAAGAPKVHSESTVKHTGPGDDTKTKKEVIIGTVKAYEPGKNLKVTGPNNKDYSYDLDKQVTLKGSFTVGERVRVTSWKSADGQKMTTVEPYSKAS